MVYEQNALDITENKQQSCTCGRSRRILGFINPDRIDQAPVDLLPTWPVALECRLLAAVHSHYEFTSAETLHHVQLRPS